MFFFKASQRLGQIHGLDDKMLLTVQSPARVL